ncbi:MAG: AGE family epimerase/isomerase [Bacteroidetes bacterium]|nr:AGE family epimerase/isomerase [Bacteroidota bacterium]
MDLAALTEQYRNGLIENILPFWDRHAFDTLYPGVFEALDETGAVISTDKPVTTQAQAVWAFAFAHKQFGPHKEWLERAMETADFLVEKGRTPKGNWYQLLDRRGQPLEEAQDMEPGLYAVQALGQLYKATGEKTYVELAQKTLVQLLKKRDAQLNKQLQDTSRGRSFKSLREFALIGHVLLDSESYMDRKWYKKTLDAYMQELMNDFYDKRTDILLENVTPEGHFWDCPEGRLLVPGRVFEVAGLMMDVADRTRNRKLLNQMLDLLELTVQAAWDETHGGFYYLMDVKSLPPLQVRWHHKLAWVHLAALQALLKAHVLSARPVFLTMFEKTHAYVWERFPDPAHGEWFGELTRDGQPFLRHKITPEKGCYEMVRYLHGIAQLLSNVVRASRPS